jgi:hypothetical protein
VCFDLTHSQYTTPAQARQSKNTNHTKECETREGAAAKLPVVPFARFRGLRDSWCAGFRFGPKTHLSLTYELLKELEGDSGGKPTTAQPTNYDPVYQERIATTASKVKPLLTQTAPHPLTYLQT